MWTRHSHIHIRGSCPDSNDLGQFAADYVIIHSIELCKIKLSPLDGAGELLAVLLLLPGLMET